MFYVQWVHGTEDLSSAHALRYRVFVEEQGYPESTEVDNYDIMAWHCQIMVDGNVVATGRVYLDGDVFKVGRICVDANHRGQGYGDAVTRLLLDRALAAGAKKLAISAQTYCMDLYTKFGFTSSGSEYYEDDVPRAHMLLLANAEDIVFPTDCNGDCDACKLSGGDR